MNKILFMLLFVIGCMTPLAALNLDPPQKGVISQSMQWGEEDSPMIIAVIQEVNILHRDSLMYGSKDWIDHNIKNNGVGGLGGDKKIYVKLSGKFEVGWQKKTMI